MDILGPLPESARGNKYILVIRDYFTKWKEAHAMPNMEAITVARILVNEFICRFGIPEQLHTDQGRNFESTLIKEICKILGITKTRTTPYHPQSDGMIERFNRTVLNMLSTVVSDDEYNWDLHLPTLMLAYRTSRHETTGATPFSLVYGREAKLPEDILFNLPTAEEVTTSHGYAEALKERIQQAYQRVRDHSAVEQRKQKANYDQLAQASTFETGGLVWLHCPAVPRGEKPKVSSAMAGPIQGGQENWKCCIPDSTSTEHKETTCRTLQQTQEILFSAGRRRRLSGELDDDLKLAKQDSTNRISATRKSFSSKS